MEGDTREKRKLSEGHTRSKPNTLVNMSAIDLGKGDPRNKKCISAARGKEGSKESTKYECGGYQVSGSGGDSGKEGVHMEKKTKLMTPKQPNGDDSFV